MPRLGMSAAPSPRRPQHSCRGSTCPGCLCGAVGPSRGDAQKAPPQVLSRVCQVGQGALTQEGGLGPGAASARGRVCCPSVRVARPCPRRPPRESGSQALAPGPVGQRGGVWERSDAPTAQDTLSARRGAPSAAGSPLRAGSGGRDAGCSPRPSGARWPDIPCPGSSVTTRASPACLWTPSEPGDSRRTLRRARTFRG